MGKERKRKNTLKKKSEKIDPGKEKLIEINKNEAFKSSQLMIVISQTCQYLGNLMLSKSENKLFTLSYLSYKTLETQVTLSNILNAKICFVIKESVKG